MAAHKAASRLASFVAVIGLAGGLAGCAGTDVQVDAPILEAAGINLTSKPPPEPDLAENPPLVVPPDTKELPKPGERKVAEAGSDESWPEDPDVIAKRKAKEAEKKREEYCRKGDWSDDANIEEFRKALGQEQRCPSQLGKALSTALGGSTSDSDSE